MKIAISTAAIPLAMLLSLHLVGCERIESGSTGSTATDALLMAKAGSTSAAVSALNSLDSGDVKVARSTLEAQVVGGITVLRAMESEKTPANAEMIDKAISEAEDYLTKHNLTVPALPARN